MKKDLVLILIILILSLVLWLGLRACQTEAQQVLVTIDGEPFGTYALAADQTVRLPHHTLVLKDGTAYLTASDCSGQDCVKTGAISRGGQAILCLPYRLNIQVSAARSAVDAVTY